MIKHRLIKKSVDGLSRLPNDDNAPMCKKKTASWIRRDCKFLNVNTNSYSFSIILLTEDIAQSTSAQG